MNLKFLVPVVMVLIGVRARASGYSTEVWNAMTKGAGFDVSFQVVDDEGNSVAGAKCSGWMAIEQARNHGSGYEKSTDTNGCVRIVGKCSEWFSLIVQKDGFYTTSLEVKYPARDTTPSLADGKWQPYGETRTVVLKKIKNPWAVKVHTDEQRHRKIPAFDQWLPFDMEVSDWLSPYGNGVHNDVLLRFNKAGSGRVGDFAFTMDACFTNNPYAGFYCKPSDVFSDLRTDYCADTNADYCTDYRFMIDAFGKGRVKEMGLAKDSYLVFRTRTRVDENGRLIGAHYGKYCGGWRSDNTELHLGAGCFNPVENDTNIEGNQPLLYKIRNYKNKK